MTTTKPDYRAYIHSPRWRAKASSAAKLWRGRCALMPWLPSQDYHHLSYENLGIERPWFDCLPLSRSAHKLVHCPLFWARRKPRAKRRRIAGWCWRAIALATLLLTLFLPSKSHSPKTHA